MHDKQAVQHKKGKNGERSDVLTIDGGEEVLDRVHHNVAGFLQYTAAVAARKADCSAIIEVFTQGEAEKEEEERRTKEGEEK